MKKLTEVRFTGTSGLKLLSKRPTFAVEDADFTGEKNAIKVEGIFGGYFCDYIVEESKLFPFVSELE